jgi:hypothetical protein
MQIGNWYVIHVGQFRCFGDRFIVTQAIRHGDVTT